MKEECRAKPVEEQDNVRNNTKRRLTARKDAGVDADPQAADAQVRVEGQQVARQGADDPEAGHVAGHQLRLPAHAPAARHSTR